MDPWSELERLIREVPEPYDRLRLDIERHLIRATASTSRSAGLREAIAEFEAEVAFMIQSCELYGRDQVDLVACSRSCRESLRVIHGICRLLH